MGLVVVKLILKEKAALTVTMFREEVGLIILLYVSA